MPSFDLLTSPWLPVLDARAGLRDAPAAPAIPAEVGLRETLLRAHEIREIHASSPLETVALDRLLLALAIDVFLPEPDPDAWIALWRAGRFPADSLDRYISRVGADRFDLLHPDHPFLQRAHPDASQDGKDPAPLSVLFQAQASGNNATLFSHEVDASPATLPLAHAARGLVATQASALGGGASQPFYFSHAPLVGRAQFWLRGRSLFEALLLNAPPTTAARMQATPDDAPLWRHDHAPDHVYSKRPHAGLLDVLTWPSRRLTLVTEPGPDGQPVATGVFLTQGDKLDPMPVDDPLAAHVDVKNKGTFPLGLRADRAVWRDAAVLFQTTGAEASRPPATFGWVATVSQGLTDDEYDRLQRTLRDDGADVFGLVNDQAKAELWRHERLPVHAPILRDARRQQLVAQALTHAEAQVSAADKSTRQRGLRHAIKTVATFALSPPPPGDEGYPSADKNAVSALARSLAAEPRYWAALEPAFFRFLTRLAAATDHAEQSVALAEWKTTVFDQAQRAFQAATSALHRDARQLRAVAEGRARLRDIAA